MTGEIKIQPQITGLATREQRKCSRETELVFAQIPTVMSAAFEKLR